MQNLCVNRVASGPGNVADDDAVLTPTMAFTSDDFPRIGPADDGYPQDAWIRLFLLFSGRRR